MMKAFRKLCIAGACLFSIGCYYDTQEALYNNVSQNTADCDTTNITYSGRITKIINSAACSGCHSSTTAALQSGVVLDNFTDLQQQAASGKLIGDINQSPGYNAMPPNANKLDPCDIFAIQIWVNRNTPNN